MRVSKNGCLQGKIPLEWMIWVYPHFRKHLYVYIDHFLSYHAQIEDASPSIQQDSVSLKLYQILP